MKSKRNYGLDLFRMFSMFGVIILHLLGHGGALTAPTTPYNLATLWFLETAAYPAVNCFVLLAGFVGYRSDKIYPKISNIISIVFTTLFYSLVACFVYGLLFPQEITLKSIAFSALPVITRQYWFVSAYVGMFLFSPIINLFVCKADRKMLAIATGISIVFAFSALLKDPFGFSGGYSTIWFILLYMLGAIIKKENLLHKLSVVKGLVCVAVGFAISFGIQLVFSFLVSPLSALADFFISYCSPTVLLMAIGWMAIFAKINPTPVSNKIIGFITPSVFSVYLIHDNPYIRKLFISDRFSFLNTCNPLTILGIVLISALTIFIVCLLIDFIRVLLFKILRISQLALFLEDKLKMLILLFAKA